MTGKRAFRLARTILVLAVAVTTTVVLVNRSPRVEAVPTHPPAGASSYPHRLTDLPMVPFGVVRNPDRITWLHRQPNDPSDPVRWDPCRPIHWVLNPEGGSARLNKRVQAAFATASEITGYHFVYDGPTTETAHALKDRAYQPDRYGNRWAPVLVTWHRTLGSKDSPALGIAGNDVAVGDDTSYVYVSGDIRLSAGGLKEETHDNGRRFGNAKIEAIVLHEIAHVLGLGHSNTVTDLMAKSVIVNYPSGQDRLGLRLLADSRCRPDV